MKLRKSIAVLIAMGGLAMTGVTAAVPAQAAVPRSAPAALGRQLAEQQLTLQQLLDLATMRVHTTFPRAVLMLADGASPTGPTRAMGDVTDWHLVYNTGATTGVQSLELFTDLQGEISQPVLHNQPWGGVVSIPGQIGLSPELAYSILQFAGHQDAFQYVSLLKPLVANPQLQYHFSNIRGGCDGFAVNVQGFAVNPIC